MKLELKDSHVVSASQENLVKIRKSRLKNLNPNQLSKKKLVSHLICT